MKKSILSLITIVCITACNEQPQEERAVGFTNWSDDGTEYKYHLGTESSIDVAKAFDTASKNKDYPALREIFIDTAKITYQNGITATVDEFIAMNINRDSILKANNATLDWKAESAFSVDLDPSIGGEHVNMMYRASYQDEENASQFYANLWLYIIDGKIINVRQYNQSVLAE